MNYSLRSRILLTSTFLALEVTFATAYQVSLFPAADVYDPDLEILHERLGLKGVQLLVEDFETRQLADWLQTNLQGGGGEGTERGAWGGNVASAYADSAQLRFKIPGIRLVGIGLADNDGGGEQLSVNGGTAFDLRRFPGHVIDARTRAYYVLVEAESSEPDIASVDIDHGFTINFDHLVVAKATRASNPRLRPSEPLRPRLILDLIDGTRLVGSTTNRAFVIPTSEQALSIPLEQVSSVQLQPGTDIASLVLKTGEKRTARVGFTELKVTTILGELSISRDKIRLLRVGERGEYQPPPARSRALAEKPFHATEPAWQGRSLRTWLEQTRPIPRAGNMADLLAPGADDKSAERLAAEQAIRQMSPHAVPFLLEMLRRGDQDAREAVSGFEALGTLGRSALPNLLLLLDEPDETIHVSSIWSIGHLRAAAASAVPVLLDELRHGSLPAAEALGQIGPAARSAVPIMISMLQNGSQPYDVPLIVSLGKTGSSEAVPVLLDIAREVDPGRATQERGFAATLRKHRAVEALGNIGPGASSAVPTLLRLLGQTSSGNVLNLYFRHRLCSALGNIGPEARAAVPTLREIAQRAGRSQLEAAVAQAATTALTKIQTGDRSK